MVEIIMTLIIVIVMLKVLIFQQLFTITKTQRNRKEIKMLMALTVSAIAVESLLEGALCGIAIWSGRKIKKGILNN